MYVDDMSLEEARAEEKWLESFKPGGFGTAGYHGREGIEQHRWDLEDVRGHIKRLEA